MKKCFMTRIVVDDKSSDSSAKVLCALPDLG